MYSALQVGTNAICIIVTTSFRLVCLARRYLGLSITIARTFQIPDRSRWGMYNQGKCTGYICLSESILRRTEN